MKTLMNMNRNCPLVSVIIPTYGGGDELDRTITSVLSQTYEPIEIIVVDDNGLGSSNQIKTAAVIQKYVDSNAVCYITPEANGGGSVARNIGAKASSGAYLMFLDDDDTVSPDKVEKQVKALQSRGNGYGISYCSSKIFCGDQLSNIITAKKSGDILADFLLGKICIGTGTALLIREAWESIGGYDESFMRHQDWEFFSRVLNKYQAVAVSDAYFNRYILQRNLPRDFDVTEKNMEHYIAFLKTYPFRLPKKTIRNVINLNNAKTALICLKNKDYRHFKIVMGRHDTPYFAYKAFFRFLIVVIFDKLRGKKS